MNHFIKIVPFIICFLSLETKAQQTKYSGDQLFFQAAQYLLNGEYKEATNYFNQAHEIFKVKGDSIKMSDCMMGIGSSYFMQGQNQLALTVFTELKNSVNLADISKDRMELIDDNIRMIKLVMSDESSNQ